MLLEIVGTLLVGAGVLFMLSTCVDPESPTPVGRVAYFVTEVAPGRVMAFATRLHLRWLADAVVGGVNWFLHKPHPLIQIAYVLLVFGAYGAFFVHGYPLLPNRYMAGYHKVIGVFVFLACVITFYKASFVNPGTITRDNANDYLRLYRYDNFMFELRECKTCAIPKPARSKHCAVCDRCVSKFDHHCIWLNNCVGERNYRWFLAYLICNSIIMVYGGIACVTILLEYYQRAELGKARFVNAATGQYVEWTYGILLQHLLHQFTEIMMILLLCSVMGVIIVGFTLYHCVLAATGMTTNEGAKWKELEYYHDMAVKRWKRAIVIKHLQDERKAAAAAATAAGKAVEAAADDDDELNQPIPEHILREPIPMPSRSAYDRGVWNNLRDVFFPPSLRDPEGEQAAADDGQLSGIARAAATAAQTAKVARDAKDARDSASGSSASKQRPAAHAGGSNSGSGGKKR